MKLLGNWNRHVSDASVEANVLSIGCASFERFFRSKMARVPWWISRLRVSDPTLDYSSMMSSRADAGLAFSRMCSYPKAIGDMALTYVHGNLGITIHSRHKVACMCMLWILPRRPVITAIGSQKESFSLVTTPMSSRPGSLSLQPYALIVRAISPCHAALGHLMHGLNALKSLHCRKVQLLCLWWM